MILPWTPPGFGEKNGVDWFARLTGFREAGRTDTLARLELHGSRLRSRVNGADYAIGSLALVSLDELRVRTPVPNDGQPRLRFGTVSGDVRRLHHQPANAGAVFQVASQFNLLEMVSPNVSPDDGVTGYEHDPTQGPACAIAAGAATIYRNYFVPVAGQQGQTAERQLDALADLGAELSARLGLPVHALWHMRNGYALATPAGLAAISRHLEGLSPAETDDLRGKLRIGLHEDVEVTDAPGPDRPLVSQAFCSALPVAYSRLPATAWEPFARLVLEAAYEATLRAALLNAGRGKSNTVFLTRLGGGAFGNHPHWIDAALERAMALCQSADLDIRLVTRAP
jgi:hypothetical protein